MSDNDRLSRNLYQLGYNAEKLRELFRLIDWMMHLREDLGQKLAIELTALEESLDMPYVTSVERIAEARGEARGEAKGRASVVLKLLDKLCGPLPDNVQQQVCQLPVKALEALADALLDFRSLEHLQSWLDANAGNFT